jgi:hypothetical protein
MWTRHNGTDLQPGVVTFLQQLFLGRARQQRGKWSAHDRIEHRLRGMLLPYFQEGMMRRRITALISGAPPKRRQKSWLGCDLSGMMAPWSKKTSLTT